MRRRISGWTVGVSLVILAGIAAWVLWPDSHREVHDYGNIWYYTNGTLDSSVTDWEYVKRHAEDSTRKAKYKEDEAEWTKVWADVAKAQEQAEDRRIERIVRKVLKEAKPVKQIVDTCERRALTAYPILDFTSGTNTDSAASRRLRELFNRGLWTNEGPVCPTPLESLPIWEDLRKRRIEGRYPDSTGGVWVGVPKQ